MSGREPEVLPANIRIAKAPLPASYDAAKAALATCVSADECKKWADKAQALASYAQQADDDSLLKLATRIQARAIRRAGELLQEFDARGDHRKSAGGDTSSQRQAAEEAGMSKRQQVTAVRLANVPHEAFEAAVESDDPPTVTALAEIGKKARPVPEGFQEATRGVLASETAEVRQKVAAIDHWLDRFIVSLRD